MDSIGHYKPSPNCQFNCCSYPEIASLSTQKSLQCCKVTRRCSHLLLKCCGLCIVKRALMQKQGQIFNYLHFQDKKYNSIYTEDTNLKYLLNADALFSHVFQLVGSNCLTISSYTNCCITFKMISKSNNNCNSQLCFLHLLNWRFPWYHI